MISATSARNVSLLRFSFSRQFSSGKGYNSVTYDQLIKMMEAGSVKLIDVREPHEVLETGRLQHGKVEAVNVPLASVMNGALNISNKDFYEEFGCDKPKKDENIVFSCRSGIRSEHAANHAVTLGFSKVMNYRGSASEWFSKHK